MSEVNYDKVPVDYMKDVTRNYIDNGLSGGGFMTALFSNNLVKTYMLADDENRDAIKQWVSFIYNSAPAGCWGSKEKVQAWIKDGGITGRYKKKEVSNE